MDNQLTLLDIQEATSADMAEVLKCVEEAMRDIDSIANAVFESECLPEGVEHRGLIKLGIDRERHEAEKYFADYENLEHLYLLNVEKYVAGYFMYDYDSCKDVVENCLTRVMTDISNYYPHLLGGEARRWQRGEMLIATECAICSSSLLGILSSPCEPRMVGRCLFDARISLDAAKIKFRGTDYDGEVALFQMRMMDSQRTVMDQQKALLNEQAEAAKVQVEIASESAKQSVEMLNQSTAMTNMTTVIKWCTIATLTISALTLLVTLLSFFVSNFGGVAAITYAVFSALALSV